VTQPPQVSREQPVVILLNGGIIYRVGPNRLYVNVARALAGANFTNLRFDFSGIGDSTMGEAAGYSDVQMQDAIEAMDFLEKQTGARRFVLIGLCTGADVSIKAALADPRVVGIMAINGQYLEGKDLDRTYPQAKKHTSMRYYKKYKFDSRRLLKVVTGKSNFFRNAWKFLRKRESPAKEPLALSFSLENACLTLLQRNVNVFVLYSEGSTTLDLYELFLKGEKKREMERYRNYTFEVAGNVDHVFTPVWSQQYLQHKIVNWVTLLDS
jgi:alpha/beta superfamily hydrolase